MTINHGKLALRPITYEGQTYGLPVTADGRLWKDVATAQPGRWFIAVDDGTIISAETDPMSSLVVGPDIWEITHAGPGAALRGKHWDGEKVT